MNPDTPPELGVPAAAGQHPPANDTPYSSRHPGDPDPRDLGFCRCGLGLDAWVHTDSRHYVEIPLAEWRRHG